MDPGEKLKIVSRNCVRFRRELGENVTQNELADLAGISVFSISRYEGGSGLPSRDALLKLAEVFGRNVEDFFLPEPPPPIRPAKRPVFALKVLGKEVDPQLEQEVRDFLALKNGEHMRRVVELKRQQAQEKERKAGAGAGTKGKGRGKKA